MSAKNVISRELITSRVTIDPETGCWLWPVPKSGTYGTVQINGKPHRVHRLAWELWNNKKIPEGLLGCHHCDNPPCCNPEHIFIGTIADNTADMVAKGRSGRTPGSKHHQAKLNEEQVLDIRSSTETRREAAARYGVSPLTIKKIRVRETWTHV